MHGAAVPERRKTLIRCHHAWYTGGVTVRKDVCERALKRAMGIRNRQTAPDPA